MGVILLGKIKIYEIAKKLNLTSKEVLEMAQKLNIDVKSHMSGVEEEEAKKIEAQLTNNSNEKTKKTGVSSIGLVTAGVAGAMTNTLLVMNLIFLFFREAYASANNVAVSGVYTFILSIIGINGVPEAIVAGVLTLCIGRALLKKNVREKE